MDARGAAQDADGSRRAGNAGLRLGRFGRQFRPAARGVVPAVRLPDADRRQPHQRPLGLPQRLRRQRPAGTRTGLRAGLDHAPRHASRNRPDDRGRLHHGLRTALLRGLVADRRRRVMRRIRISLHGRPLPAGLPRLGATCWCWSSSDSSPSGCTSYVLSGGWTWQTASFRRPAGWRSTPC